ncbi:hypothetical protein SAV14893_091300 [Streptomyces avermitilis]|uniref:Alcohol dehydrogenase-like N-terminal domain-containing protein n=1 Tax=Streptomyces avermitilis TaxID=33903 RepID=A0A4D4MEE8_STRAX|nr:hypothetical protein SAV14893_091300 [Streptomyces avermitilis]GDY79995.1 hypothetical protein SAV31267_094800 [Streptomyces avermitilis]
MTKALYEIGETPPLGEVPRQMYASVIRQNRFGEPKQAFRTEVVDTPAVGRGQVLVYVMAAGINYNNVWSSLGEPVDVIGMRQRQGQPEDFHIGGSEASGVVWAVGEGVRSVTVGDHVLLTSGQWDEAAADIRMGTDPLVSESIKAWGTRPTTVPSRSSAVSTNTSATPSPPICHGRSRRPSCSPGPPPTGSCSAGRATRSAPATPS